MGLVSLSVPDSLTGEPERIETHKNLPPNGVNSTSYSRKWNGPPKPGGFFPSISVFLLVVTREADFRKAWGAEPDFLLSLQHKDNEADKAKHSIADDEVSYLELNDLRGSFYKIQNPFVEDDVRIGWSAYRYYMNKAQSIDISINGPRNDLSRMMTILHSLKLR